MLGLLRPFGSALGCRGASPAFLCHALVFSRPVSGLVGRSIHSMAQIRIDEQHLPRYRDRKYCSVYIGQTLRDRYHILAKLGFGAYSTVWLARDQKTDQYTAIKAYVRADSSAEQVSNEINMLKHLNSCPAEYAGPDLARLANDFFEVDGYHCLAMNPQAGSLQNLKNTLGGRLPVIDIRIVVIRLLSCLNWLELECGVVHTEITAPNILLSPSDDDIFKSIEREEIANPSTPIFDETHPYPHPIYESRGQLFQPPHILELAGNSRLADLGSARKLASGEKTEGWWMPDTYRAPEILLGLPWDHLVDMWSIGVMVLELLEGKRLFDPLDYVRKQYVVELALAQYIGYMGLPPKSMLDDASAMTRSFFDQDGQWIGEAPIPATSFEDFVTVIPPGEEKTQFMEFIRKMLTWDPTVRNNHYDLFGDEWLTGALRAQGVIPSDY